MQAKYKQIREEAHRLGRLEFARLGTYPTFRDFVCLYIAEGYKRDRNRVSIANSDPAAMVLALHWITRFSARQLEFTIQYHSDQRLTDLQAFWGDTLDLPDLEIKFHRKSNSGQLEGRTWRSKYGVLTIRVSDTPFRARLQGWIDCMRNEWLDSNGSGA